MSVYHLYNNIIPSKSIRTAVCTNIKGNQKKYLIYACNNYINVCTVDKNGCTDDYSNHSVFCEILELREYVPEKLIDKEREENERRLAKQTKKIKKREKDKSREKVKSYLFVLTKKYNLLLLEFNLKTKDFITLNSINLSEINGMNIEEDITFLLDDRHRTILFYGYKNILKYICLDYDDYLNLSHLYTLRLDERLIIDMAFLKNDDHRIYNNTNSMFKDNKPASKKGVENNPVHIYDEEYEKVDLHTQDGANSSFNKKGGLNLEPQLKSEHNTDYQTKNKNQKCSTNNINDSSSRCKSGESKQWSFVKKEEAEKESDKENYNNNDIKKKLPNSDGENNGDVIKIMDSGKNEIDKYISESKWRDKRNNVDAIICILYDSKNKDSYIYERYIRLIPINNRNENRTNYEASNKYRTSTNKYNNTMSTHFVDNDNMNSTSSNDNYQKYCEKENFILPNYYKALMVDSSINKIVCLKKNRILLIGFQFINFINFENNQDKNFFLSSELRTIRCVEKLGRNKFILADDYGDIFILSCLSTVDNNSHMLRNSKNNDNYSSDIMNCINPIDTIHSVKEKTNFNFKRSKEKRNSIDVCTNLGIYGYSDVESINLQFIGTCSRSNIIVSIYSDIIFLGSQVSDSYLLRMHNYPVNSNANSAFVGNASNNYALNPSDTIFQTNEKYYGNLYIDNLNNDNINTIQKEFKNNLSGNIEEEKKFYIEILSFIQNMGPILDFCLIENKNEEREIVTCNSYGRTGCISIIRNGLKTNIISKLDFDKITNIFSVKYIIYLKKYDPNVDDKENNMNRQDKPGKSKGPFQFKVFATLNNKKHVEIKDIDLSFLNKYFFENENDINVLKYSNFIYFHIFIICLSYGFHTKVIGVCIDREREKNSNTSNKNGRDRNDSIFNGFYPGPEEENYKKETQNEILLCEYENTDIELNVNTIYFNTMSNHPYIVQVTNECINLFCCLSMKLIYKLKFSFICKFFLYKDYFYIYCEDSIKIYTIYDKVLIFVYEYKFDKSITSLHIYKGCILACVFNNKEVVLYNIYNKLLTEMRNKVISNKQDTNLDGLASGENSQSNRAIFTQVCHYIPEQNFFIFISDIRIVEFNDNLYLFIGYSNGDLEYFLLRTHCEVRSVGKIKTGRGKKIRKIRQSYDTFKSEEKDLIQKTNVPKHSLNAQNRKINCEEAIIDPDCSGDNLSKDKSEVPSQYDNEMDLQTGKISKMKKNNNEYEESESSLRDDNSSSSSIKTYFEINKKYEKNKKKYLNILKIHKKFLKKKETSLKCIYQKNEDLNCGMNYKMNKNKNKIINDIEKEKKLKKSKIIMLKYLSKNYINLFKHFNFSKEQFKNIYDLHNLCAQSMDQIKIESKLFYNMNINSDNFISIDKFLKTERTYANLDNNGDPMCDNYNRYGKNKNTYVDLINEKINYNSKNQSESSKYDVSSSDMKNAHDDIVSEESSGTVIKKTKKYNFFSNLNLWNTESKNTSDKDISSHQRKKDNLNWSSSDIINDNGRKGSAKKSSHVTLNKKRMNYFFNFYQVYGLESDDSTIDFCTFKRKKLKRKENCEKKKKKKKKYKNSQNSQNFNKIIDSDTYGENYSDIESELIYHSSFSFSSNGTAKNNTKKKLPPHILKKSRISHRNNSDSCSELDSVSSFLGCTKKSEKENENLKNAINILMNYNKNYNSDGQDENKTYQNSMNNNDNTNKRKREISIQNLDSEKNNIYNFSNEKIKSETFPRKANQISVGIEMVEKVLVEHVEQNKVSLNDDIKNKVNKRLSTKLKNTIFYNKHNKWEDKKGDQNISQTFSSSDNSSSCLHDLNNIFFDQKVYLKKYIIKGGNVLLTNRRKINVCRSAIKFKQFSKFSSEKNKIDINNNNNMCVKKSNFLFICSDNPIIIYSDIKKKISLSKVSIKNIFLVDIFNDFDYLNPFHNFNSFKKKNQNNLYFIFFDGLSLYISHLNEINETYIQKIPFYRTVEKIAYHKESGLLITSCPPEEKHKTNKNLKQIICFFNPHQNSFKYSYIIPSKYNVSSICVYQINKDIYPNKSSINTLICVGTANINDRVSEPSSGHIYIFFAKKKANLFEIKHIYTHNVNVGGITHLKQFYDKLITTINNTVVILDISEFLINLDKYVDNTNKPVKLENDGTIVDVASFTPSSWIMSLDVIENYIVVGDIMTSVTILSYDFNNSILTEVCRDYSNVWCTFVCALSKSHFLVSDMESNFLVFQKSSIKYNDEDSFKLSRVALFNHGHVVNKMLPVSLSSLIEEEEPQNEILRKKESILCASSEGSISSIIPFSNLANFKKALCIELALNDSLSSIGNINDNSNNTYKMNLSEKSCKGVVDGEVFKMFFSMPFEKQFKTYIYAKWIAKKLNCKFGTFENFMLDIENLCSFL
ncbi:conserved Plasmodium protein, unknown function [Plasmodium chabaudi chabaudi]|uniref:Cleavage/polyadenylation specificity factor A subunit C-terminal domain-containing protein n=1 Tax=Plasmodium chabaudi chabaudi TaxID=31271 RepID=A0A4V0K6H0_PLACU|nr:conserved Plasmodium protein, unknown function [Plasmodium chabaudi chabaudi]VTZ68284.1 conserved Plasmodium protein, unknown function [Plasmodium chabaudi chabaudi]|eukprot:XP_016653736.1 conserved Plasmodium protein, unknown function [Plasmodium chabaudi chabaudi]